MDILDQYVVVVVMASCVGIGAIIKHSLPFIPNKYIPLILGALGILFNAWSQQWAFDLNIVLGGLASGLAATGAFEMFKNLFGGNGA